MSAIKFTGPSDTIKFDFRKLPTPMVEWRGTAKDLHEILFKATIDAPSGDGWVRVDSGKLPEDGELYIVAVTCPDGRRISNCGMFYRNDRDDWGFVNEDESYGPEEVTHWMKWPAPPQADAPPQPCNHKTQAEADACREKHILEAMGEADAPQGEK